MIKVSVIGATGYAGVELVRLLTTHPEVTITHLVSHSFNGKQLSDIYPSFKGMQAHTLEDMNLKAIAQDSDCIFTSLPHGTSDDVIAELYGYGKKVIDLSGDYRYNSAEVYEKWYGFPHAHPELLAQSVYGMPELHKESNSHRKLIGNPRLLYHLLHSCIGAACKKRNHRYRQHHYRRKIRLHRRRPKHFTGNAFLRGKRIHEGL